jgi:peptide/nickel transport system permease protein
MTEAAFAQHAAEGPAPLAPAGDVAAVRRRMPMKLWIGVGIVAIFVLLAILAPVIAPFDPNEQDLRARLASPDGTHLLGTDGVGRDNLSRLLYAARIDLLVTFAAVVVAALIGLAVGCIAGYLGGLLDIGLMRLAEVVRAFPLYVLVLALVAVLGPGADSIIIASIIVSWVMYARITRAEVLRVRGMDFIAAARSGGLSTPRIIRRHVLPNVVAQPLIFMMSDLVMVLLALSALSFLGLGVQPPTAEWGRMIVEAQPFIQTQPWLILLPGAMIVVLGIGFSLIGDGLDDRLRGRT